eukprot:CAMPEP_0171076732 /NCGR_PEP_ID=MMETSP0766_2-20121228/13604_1 /TAXON_ID=439317 /ORGANISM="Gambierdiscus australes, Strain CAWD 149" /LENGTH=45 /DNA_ID= /DNA_START= /DNA_END= /DNA_ORIENTATION=
MYLVAASNGGRVRQVAASGGPQKRTSRTLKPLQHVATQGNPYAAP